MESSSRVCFACLAGFSHGSQNREFFIHVLLSTVACRYSSPFHFCCCCCSRCLHLRSPHLSFPAAPRQSFLRTVGALAPLFPGDRLCAQLLAGRPRRPSACLLSLLPRPSAESLLSFPVTHKTMPCTSPHPSKHRILRSRERQGDTAGAKDGQWLAVVRHVRGTAGWRRP
ncbi:hypothetical protein BRADI_4g13686v3 [Brachypodium distachyon]|uniref:Uncharacterized protein n=1 Tax=Brachypodium distachyon TaxID=15368 RepID=A0A0Q3EJD4_BRADI|nr:hypothetical protein BRADI_4g13686v3 [Brachypodium distachyon]